VGFPFPGGPPFAPLLGLPLPPLPLPLGSGLPKRDLSGLNMAMGIIAQDVRKRIAFADPHDEYGLSLVAQKFIAGQLKHVMCAASRR